MSRLPLARRRSAGDPRRLPARGRRGRGPGGGAPGRAARVALEGRPRPRVRDARDGRQAREGGLPEGLEDRPPLLPERLPELPQDDPGVEPGLRASLEGPEDRGRHHGPGAGAPGVLVHDGDQLPGASLAGPRVPAHAERQSRAPHAARRGGREDRGPGAWGSSTPSAWESSSSPEGGSAPQHPRAGLCRVPGEDRAEGRQGRERLRRAVRGDRARARPRRAAARPAESPGSAGRRRRSGATTRGGRRPSSFQRSAGVSRTILQGTAASPSKLSLPCAGKGSQGSTDRRQCSWWTNR